MAPSQETMLLSCSVIIGTRNSVACLTREEPKKFTSWYGYFRNGDSCGYA